MPPVYGKKYVKYTKPSDGLTAKQRAAVRKIVARKGKSLMEPKRVVVSDSHAVIAGNGYIINPLYNISQNTTMASRVGNRIHLDKLIIHMEFEASAAGGKPTDYGLWVFWSDEQITTNPNWSVVVNSSVASTLPFQGSTAGGMVTLQHLDISQAKEVCYRHFDVQEYSATYGVQKFTKTFNFKGKKLQYLTDVGSFFQGQNLYFAVIGDSPGSTVGTTTVGSVRVSYQVQFTE